jgi:RIB43A
MRSVREFEKTFSQVIIIISDRLIIDNQSRLNANVLTALDDKVKLARRQHLEKINLFRKTEVKFLILTQQKTQERRDYDLYDPLQLKKETPPRTLVNEFGIGASSLQKFDGEDLDFAKRQTLQKKQMQIWADQRIHEQGINRQAQLDEKMYFRANNSRKYDKFQMNLNQKMNALQNAVEQAKKDQAKHDYEFNFGLVSGQSDENSTKKKRKEIDSKSY